TELIAGIKLQPQRYPRFSKPENLFLKVAAPYDVVGHHMCYGIPVGIDTRCGVRQNGKPGKVLCFGNTEADVGDHALAPIPTLRSPTARARPGTISSVNTRLICSASPPFTVMLKTVSP